MCFARSIVMDATAKSCLMFLSHLLFCSSFFFFIGLRASLSAFLAGVSSLKRYRWPRKVMRLRLILELQGSCLDTIDTINYVNAP